MGASGVEQGADGVVGEASEPERHSLHPPDEVVRGFGGPVGSGTVAPMVGAAGNDGDAANPPLSGFTPCSSDVLVTMRALVRFGNTCFTGRGRAWWHR